MKTDRFTDIIRRKLESIRPEFTDKDWARMQSTLNEANVPQPNTPGAHQPFSGGIWSGQSWLLAAATVSTVLLVAFGIWQRREINQLRQTIGHLQPQLTNRPVPALPRAEEKEQLRPDVAQSSDVTRYKTQEAATPATRNASQAIRPDTVYITRYVAAPPRAKPDTRAEERISQRLTVPTGPVEQQQNVTETPVTFSSPHQSPTLPLNKQTESYDASSTSPSGAKNTYDESTVANKSTRTSARQDRLASRQTRNQTRQQSGTSSANLIADKVAITTSSLQPEPTSVATETSANYDLAASRPLTLSTKNWTIPLGQRAKRMQPARTVVVAAEAVQEVTSQPVQQLATRFRAGVGGEVASRLWSAGVYTEVLLGRHWMVEIGLNQATYLNRFITEDDFNGRTQRDFRKEFGRNVAPLSDILNIDTRQVDLQVPINLGYRVPINQTLTVLTSVGTSLNLTNSENVTFYCRQLLFPPMQPQPLQRGFQEIDISKSQPVDLINNIALSAGIEWQRGHWVVQATPVLTIPTQTNPSGKQTDLNWRQNATAGLRARLLYQF